MRAHIDVAVLAKAKNVKGRFAARSVAGLPFLLEPGDEVALVPPKTDVPRNVVVSSVSQTGDKSADVTFEGVDDADIASQMVGMHCLIKRELVDESVFQQSPGTWEGWVVADAQFGELGHVRDIVENPAQMLMEVERPSGQALLVPVVDEIVIDVDVEGRQVLTRIPNGLLDL